ncbi:endonuclease domain-containing protein [Citricoccus sp. GCM10030269]
MDVESFGRGLYRTVDEPRLSWADVGLSEAGHGIDPQSLAAVLSATQGALSHQSAAHLYGVPLPPWLEDEPTAHITGSGPELRSRRPGITGHRRPLSRADVVMVHGLVCTTPERTWLDLASLLRPGMGDHLVAAGDHLVKHPWVGGQREPPWTTPGRLHHGLERIGRFKGVRLARAALPLIRVGADSPTETMVRLTLIDAGLPEPELQIRATGFSGDPYPADLGYREAKIALQYDGEHHRSAEQQLIDARRDAWFIRHGWTVIRITADDLQDDLRTVIRQLRSLLADIAA